MTRNTWILVWSAVALCELFLMDNLSNSHSLSVLLASSYAPPFCIRRMLIMGALPHFINHGIKTRSLKRAQTWPWPCRTDHGLLYTWLSLSNKRPLWTKYISERASRLKRYIAILIWLKSFLSYPNRNRKQCFDINKCTLYHIVCSLSRKHPVLEDIVKTSKIWTCVVNFKLAHIFSWSSMILMKVCPNWPVCICISPLIGLQNNIVIDCFVWNRSAWCILQHGTQAPSSADALYYKCTHWWTTII